MNKTAYLTPLLGPVLCLSLGGCRDKHDMLEQTVHSVGPTGGVARSADGSAIVRFGAGALSRTREVRITTHRDEDVEDAASLVYELSPANLTFAANVVLEIKTDGISSGDVVIEQIDERAKSLEVLETSVSDDGERAVASLKGASRYVARELRGACRDLLCGEVCRLCPPGADGCMEPAVDRVCSARGLCVPAGGVRCDPYLDAGGTMVDGGGSMVDGGGSMVDGGGTTVDGGGSMVDGGGTMVDGGGSTVDGGGSMVDGGGGPDLDATPGDATPVPPDAGDGGLYFPDAGRSP